MNSKVKKTLVLLGLALAVTLGFCGCGPSEEEVYEILGRVEQKQKKIKDANLSMDQGFQEKLDLLERQFTSANRAFSKGDYSATAKFLQEAESAADWIMNRGPLRAEADEKYSELQSRKMYSNSNEINAPKYASTIYAEAEKYEQQGREAYEKIEFEEATRLYVLATNEYKKAASTASVFHEFTQKTVTAREKTKEAEAARWAHKILMDGISDAQKAFEANTQGRYDEALQLLESAEDKFENATTTASQFTTAQQNANGAKEKADKEKASQFASTIYQSALSQFQQAIKANAQGRYDEALQLLESAENKFENAAATASRFTAAQQKANVAKEKADKGNIAQHAPKIYNDISNKMKQAIAINALGKYDEALCLLESAEHLFLDTLKKVTSWNTTLEKVKKAKKMADQYYATRYASTPYNTADTNLKQAKNEKQQENFDKAIETLKTSESMFKQATKTTLMNRIPDIVYAMVKVEPGNFIMTTRDITRKVILSHAFYINKYEITEAQWKVVMSSENYEYTNDRLPVQTSAKQALYFCDKLNEAGLAPKGWYYTLPTSAQWEFAARGGKKSLGYKYSGSNTLDEVAWLASNSERKFHEVAGKKPNELGLFDMNGNAAELCRDFWDADVKRGTVTDPFLWTPFSKKHMVRGCDVFTHKNNFWWHYESSDYARSAGFRVVLVPAD